jgi:putative phosphoserine phosphatase/1-acylglycerol-3-phosphate O-acyltransferase
MPRAIAVFDVDGTIVPGASCELLFVRHLVRKRALRAAAGGRWLSAFLGTRPSRWKRLLLENKAYLGGQRVEDVDRLAGECFTREIARRISPRARARIEAHRAEGLEIVLLSGTLRCLLDRVGRELGADRLHGTDLEVRDGRLTGAIAGVHPWGGTKRDIVLQHYGGAAFDLTSSHAYADRASDLPFLEVFGHPAAVNPTAALRRRAAERGIPVERFPRS